MNTSDENELLDLITKYGVHDFFATCSKICIMHAATLIDEYVKTGRQNMFIDEDIKLYAYASQKTAKLAEDLKANKHLPS